MSNRSEISSRTCEIAQAVEAGQLTMFRLAERDHGLTLKILALESGIPFGTLRTYAQGTAMPVSALCKLSRVIPNALTSLMLDPAGKEICDAEASDTDFDDLARVALDYASAHAAFRHPQSDGGIRLVHTETPSLKMKARALKAAAKKVAA